MEKEMNKLKLKLNLGCGGDLKKGYLNIDTKDIKNLPKGYTFRQGDCGDLFFIADKTVDEIYAKYLIEHIHILNLKEYFFEWRRVLKKDGELVLIFPDFDKIISEYNKCKELKTLDDFMNYLGLTYHLLNPTQRQLVKSDQHRAIITKRLIKVLLESEGFKITSTKAYGSVQEQKYLTLIRTKKVRID
jgi:ubiquinone/menaquinone biosynthesis C-methylase UbiE